MKTFLQTQFHTKDLGKLRYLLGIKVARSKEGIGLLQLKYVLDILDETSLMSSKPLDTKLCVDQGELTSNPNSYRRLVGKLNYLTITRLDISFVVSVVNQFTLSPHSTHSETTFRIIRYLKNHLRCDLLYLVNGYQRVEAFTDTN